MLDSLRDPGSEHGRAVWTASTIAVPWMRGTLTVSDSALATPDGQWLFATLRLQDANGTPIHLPGYPGKDIYISPEPRGDSLWLSFTQTADAGIAATGRFFGDSLIGSWYDGSFGGPLHGGRFRMIRRSRT